MAGEQKIGYRGPDLPQYRDEGPVHPDAYAPIKTEVPQGIAASLDGLEELTASIPSLQSKPLKYSLEDKLQEFRSKVKRSDPYKNVERSWQSLDPYEKAVGVMGIASIVFSAIGIASQSKKQKP